MPHDRNGTALKVGDKVFLPATVKTILGTSDNHGNVVLELLPMPPNVTPYILTANTKQTEKI